MFLCGRKFVDVECASVNTCLCCRLKKDLHGFKNDHGLKNDGCKTPVTAQAQE